MIRAPMPRLFRRPLKKLIRALLALILVSVSAVLASCEEQPDRPQLPAGPYTVTQVYDGDSFNVKTGRGDVIKLRISGIDAPERGQPYGRRATDALHALLQSGPLELSADKQDRFNRWLIRAHVNGVDVGLRQIEDGWAWFFARYKSDLPPDLQQSYAQAEATARQQRAGLWAWHEPPEPPWAFRERSRKSKDQGKPNPADQREDDDRN